MQSETTTCTSLAPKEVRMEDLYKNCFPIVARFVSQLHGTFADAKDIFQDALVIYLERSGRDDLADVEYPQRYLLGIAKHLWMHKYKERSRYVRLDTFEASLSIPSEYYPSVKEERLVAFLQSASKKCLGLLRDFYYQRFTMKQIAIKNGYGSEHSATVQKYKCIEKIRETIKDKSMAYEDFFE